MISGIRQNAACRFLPRGILTGSVLFSSGGLRPFVIYSYILFKILIFLSCFFHILTLY